MSQRDLFGGAITISLPESLLDASDIRQVPDTQEVFLASDSDLSFIIEILQRVDSSDPAGAARFHFDSLAHDNEALESTITVIRVPDQINNVSPQETPQPVLLDGMQKVKKFNRPHADDVRIFLAIYRIEDKNIDLVLTANVPIVAGDGGALPPDAVAAASQYFVNAATSLKILDFGLFA